MTQAPKESGGSSGLVLAFIFIVGFVLFLVTLAPYLSSYLLLDARGADSPAVLQEVSETITTSEPDGVWARKYRVVARLVADEAPPVALLVSGATFDRLNIDQTVTIRRHTTPWAVALSRVQGELAGQTWPDRLRTWSDEAWPLFHVLWSAWLGLAVLWLFGRGGGHGCLIPLVYGLAWLAFWLSPLSDEVPRGDLRRATASVVSVTVATRLGDVEDSGGFPVVQPYQLAVVEFTPEGATHTVKALDRIDAGSFPALREEGQVEVMYQADAPRNIRIDGGSRTYWWKNLFFWWPFAAAVAVGVVCWKLACRRWPWLRMAPPGDKE